MKWLYHDVNCVRTWRWLPEKFQTSNGVTSDVACTKSAGGLPVGPELRGVGNPADVGSDYIPTGSRVRRKPPATILGLPPSYIAPSVVGASGLAGLGGLGYGYYGGLGSNEGGSVTHGFGGQATTVASIPVTNLHAPAVVVPEPSAGWVLLYAFILLLFLGKVTKR